MRFLFAVALVCTPVLIVSTAGSVQALTPPAARIEITSVVTSVTERNGVTYKAESLYNKRLRSKPIGFAVLACRPAAGTRICDAVYSLPRGRISAHGLIGNYGVYSLAVVGGTGTYLNAGGQLDVLGISTRSFELTFSLRAF